MRLERISGSVSPELKAVLRAQAEEEGVSLGEMIRTVIERGLGRSPFPEETPLEEARRLLAERARDGSVTAAVELSRQLSAQPVAPPAGDFLDELAGRRRS